MTIEDELVREVSYLRSKGVTGELFVVPIEPIMCFVQCNIGECTCRSTIDEKFCVVTKERYNSEFRFGDETLQKLNELIRTLE